MTIIRGTPPLGKPYTSQVPLTGSGIAEEITHYLMRSEQISSAVLLGVMNKREGVAAAGGIIVQAFPHASDEAVTKLEARIKEGPRLSALLDRMPIEEAVATVFQGFDYKQIDASFNVPVTYTCQCSRERALAPLTLFSDLELGEMIRDGGTDVACQFCGRKYHFDADDLLSLTPKHEA